jgi:uncharacterized iron-regulated membrane protein
MIPKSERYILSGAYRAVWRWHFYAGLIVLPVLMLMALTGAIYLFQAEIEDAVQRPMAGIAARSGVVSADRWAAAARVAGGGQVRTIEAPDRPDRAVRITVVRDDGSRVRVFVDPHDAQVTGVAPAEGVTDLVRNLHSLALVGPWANIVVEIVAGWAMVLAATGVFLWWPRRRAAGVMTVKARSGRPFWRDLHAVTGLYAGGVIFFLALTGMPWSAVWGDRFLDVVRQSGLGRPPAPAAAPAWRHAEHQDAPAGVGWTMEHAALAGGAHGPEASLERVVVAATAADLPRPWTISAPRSPGLAWTVARQVKQVQDTRTLYVDGVTGQVRADVRYAQFGVGAKAFEWGVAVHQGTQYGWINRYVMLGGCVAVWLLAISGLVMWWRRRPSGRLGAPTAPPGPRARAAVLGIVLPLAVIFPLTGLSLVAALVLDLLVRRIRNRTLSAA